MDDPKRVVISTVAENREPYWTNLVDLYRSLRTLDGPLADARGVAYMVEAADASVRNQLEQLDVTVRVSSRFHPRCRWANKLAMLDDSTDYDYLVALDTDMVIARDFSEHLTGDCVQARVVARDTLGFDVWTSLFPYFGLSLPADRYRTAFKGDWTIPYFNSGVVVVPREHVATLGRAWSAFVLAVLEAYPLFPAISKQPFTDQIALALTLVARNLPYAALPLEMNFQTSSRYNPVVTSATDFQPFILHYHNRRTPDAGLGHGPYPSVNAVIDSVNARLASAMSSQLSAAPSESQSRTLSQAPPSVVGHVAGNEQKEDQQ